MKLFTQRYIRIGAFDHPTSKGAKELDKEIPVNEAEELLARKLTDDEPVSSNAEEEAVKRLSPRWEIRIQSNRDPIAEETKAYREIAQEVDGRYDK